jgi:lipopolysaccharide/colanic/teichoic acid biosynthesis glycosyltransferase
MKELATSVGRLSTGALTAEGDPRITRVGRWLRRLSLDELPQLFNVLRGEMSLVGPRMLAPEEHAALAAFPEWQRSVLAVKPGMTGLWQVSGRRLLPYEERVRLDLEYVRGATFWTDLTILLRTLPAVIGGRGAF